MKFIFTLSSIFTLLLAANLGIRFEPTSTLPLLRLPYGTWRASKYDASSDVYAFRNIRYAAPPIGNLRWAKPSPPQHIQSIQDGSYGHNCIQVVPPPPFDQDPSFKKLLKNADEDCLFLDVYVSGTALRNVTAASKSVMVWIHGGGYTAGSKDQSLETGIYDGTSLIQRAKNDLIVISINYRLGAFGWLAGQSMEETALPNTGLHDQRAALQWVQSYIHLLGGNRHDVSAWGESAGGGSILHHLTAQCGRLDPLFQKAVIQSPASGLMLDRSGSLERRFRSFVAASGCNVSSCHDAIACLRASNASVLKDANTKLFPGASPAPDGQLIRQIPIAEFGKGNYWKGLRSLIISHVADEGKLLAPDPAPDNFVNDTLLYTFPVCAAGEISILNKVYVESYPNATQRASSFMRDMIFAANIRAATEAYADKTWVLQYSGASGTHGSDIPATWYSSNLTNSTNLVSEKYQTYLVQHALTGNPNSKEALHWPKVAGIDAEYFSNVLDVSDNGFELIRDLQSSKTVFSLWREMIRAATDCSNV